VLSFPNGGRLEVHEDLKPAELVANYETGKRLAEHGHKVRLLPVGTTPGRKYPDAMVDGEVWEFKKPQAPTKNAVDAAIRGGKHQANKIVLDIPCGMDSRTLKRGIKGRLSQPSCSVVEVIILFDDMLIRRTKEQILRGDFGF